MNTLDNRFSLLSEIITTHFTPFACLFSTSLIVVQLGGPVVTRNDLRVKISNTKQCKDWQTCYIHEGESRFQLFYTSRMSIECTIAMLACQSSFIQLGAGIAAKQLATMQALLFQLLTSWKANRNMP